MVTSHVPIFSISSNKYVVLYFSISKERSLKALSSNAHHNFELSQVQLPVTILVCLPECAVIDRRCNRGIKSRKIQFFYHANPVKHLNIQMQNFSDLGLKMWKYSVTTSYVLLVELFSIFQISFEKMTLALPPPPRQSLSPADSSSQTCQSDLKCCLFTISRFFMQYHGWHIARTIYCNGNREC